jgi:outer membrane protein OmpA-like peptidoglycan-associated protein
MRPPPSLNLWLLLLALLGSCSSPPKPPAVDESTRRPANTAMAVELQVCKNDLANTRILAVESGRLADSTAATLERLATRQPSAIAMAASKAAPAEAPSANSIFTVQFDFASAHAIVPPDRATTLIADARTAPLVVLRGRTDGTADTPAESRIARERAATVRDYLISAGVDPSRMRATYQPVGDRIADNADPSGRALNRRVEIEVYRTLPIAMTSLNAGRP